MPGPFTNATATVPATITTLANPLSTAKENGYQPIEEDDEGDQNDPKKIISNAKCVVTRIYS